jgi:hypothetical protein
MAYELNNSYVLFSHGGTGKCLTVYGGTANNNQNVCAFQRTCTSAQDWTIKAFGTNYKIVTGVNSSYALNYYWASGKGKPGNCDIYPQSGNDADSSITLMPVNAVSNIYKIKLKNYNLYLTAKGTENSSDVRWEPLASNSTAQQWHLVDSKGFRAPFIYAGYTYEGTQYSYTNDQLSGLGNATEFVVHPGAFLGCFLNNGDLNGSYVAGCASAVADKTEQLYKKYRKPVWIGTPLVAPPTQSGGSLYTVQHTEAVYEKITTHMINFINTVSDKLSGLGLNFNTCVKGIYISDEGIFDTFPSVDDHPQVKMFQAVSDYAAAKGKQMMWSPYWGTENLEKAAHVIHRTSIFDYALLQPGYYFRTENGTEPAAKWKLNCEAIRAMIFKQRVCYQNETQILQDSQIICGRTKICCQMEIDQRYTDGSDPQFYNHYNHYEEVFGASVTGYTKASADFGFYFNWPDPKYTADAYNRIKNKVNTFSA